jgi:hypothetical protein
MSRADLRDYLKRLSHAIERMLPSGPSKNGKCLFALVLVNGDKAHYVSNSRKRRVAKAVRRSADRVVQKHPASRLVYLKSPQLV